MLAIDGYNDPPTVRWNEKKKTLLIASQLCSPSYICYALHSSRAYRTHRYACATFERECQKFKSVWIGGNWPRVDWQIGFNFEVTQQKPADKQNDRLIVSLGMHACIVGSFRSLQPVRTTMMWWCGSALCLSGQSNTNFSQLIGYLMCGWAMMRASRPQRGENEWKQKCLELKIE